jgi:transcriptional regulator with XRE-family HTH domain
VTRRPRPPASKQEQAIPNGDLQVVFGQNFRKARLDAGLTQSQAAELSGINQSNISLAEAGRLNATIRTMAALARVVGKPVSELLIPPPSRRRKK